MDGRARNFLVSVLHFDDSQFPVDDRGVNMQEETKVERSSSSSEGTRSLPPPDVDIYILHEQRAGRLVLDPAEARKEFGEEIASKLKLSPDGKYVLWPQPTNDPADPQNWSENRKNFQLFIVVLAAIVPDFDSGIGVASLFALSRQYHTTTGVINDLTTNWSLFLAGWSGIFFVMLMRRYGRLSTLFWTQLLSLGFLVGATFAPTLKVFAAMRCLTAFFGICAQVTGLYTITDLFPFHLQARKINFWTMACILSPHLSPLVFGFLIARASWRWAYGIGCMYSLGVLLLIIFFLDESMYIRQSHGKPISVTPKGNAFARRLKDIIGITGVRAAKADPSWREVLLAPLRIVWRPHLFLMLVFQAVAFGFSIGINVTITVFLQSPPPFGFGFTITVVSGIYATPVVAVVIGELLGRYLNDFFMVQKIKRNKGVFEAEARLWTCYIGVLLYVFGFVVLGSALQNHLNVAAVIVGWAVAQIAVLLITVPAYAYCSDCFPHQQGEISGLLSLARTLGGFSVAFYEVPWAERNGALQTLGCEAAIVAVCFLLVVPFLQWKGRYLRAHFSTTH
ncbi:MFS general substrate transporter [Agrocybe pediades]|nr:MFS general substrate transporter [Agrocybe pediades]